jgi:hypothetical protein
MPQAVEIVNGEPVERDTESFRKSLMILEKSTQKPVFSLSDCFLSPRLGDIFAFLARLFAHSHLTICINYLTVFHRKTVVFMPFYHIRRSFDPVFSKKWGETLLFAPKKYPFFIFCQLTAARISAILLSQPIHGNVERRIQYELGLHDSVDRTDGGILGGGGCLPYPSGIHLVCRRFFGSCHCRSTGWTALAADPAVCGDLLRSAGSSLAFRQKGLES